MKKHITRIKQRLETLAALVLVAISMIGLLGEHRDFPHPSLHYPKPMVVVGLSYIVNASFGTAILSVLLIILYSFKVQDPIIEGF